MGWLLKGDKVLASLEIAEGTVARGKGLLGRKSIDGAMLLAKTNGVHSFGLRFEIDVAWLDADHVVLGVKTMKKWRIAWPKRHTKSMLEAEAGAFERWGLQVGDKLELGG
ncbi:MAG TPA: DUF192 domain-containing protein [Acidimicrobiales bacterium]|jgi:hypothetical protein|nr:DUF192 domain-containing protein [Acidimicrobiales bacterium]